MAKTAFLSVIIKESILTAGWIKSYRIATLLCVSTLSLALHKSLHLQLQKSLTDVILFETFLFMLTSILVY